MSVFSAVILNWYQITESVLNSNIQKGVVYFLYVLCLLQDGEEIVKFLQDVLDALFAMFSTEDGNSTPHSGQVFHVLVSIISFLENPKFEHFRPVMDAYISGHFAAALVYK